MSYLNEEIKEAAIILSRAEIFRTSTRNLFFKRAQKEKGKYADRKFYNTVYHLVMETIRRKNKLDAYLDLIFAHEPLSLTIFQTALARIIVYIRKEQEYRTKKRPSLNHLLAAAKKLFTEKMDENGFTSLIEALQRIDVSDEQDLLRSRNELEQLSLLYLHPKWFVKMLSELIGTKDAVKLLETNNKKQPVWIRIVNCSNDSTEGANVKEELAGEGLSVIADQDFEDVLMVAQSKKPVVFASLFKAGKIVIQNKASSAVTHILQPFPGSTVVDLAAAPGMKSLHIWEKMEMSGALVLLDISAKRARTLNKRARKYTPTNRILPHMIHADSVSPPLRLEIADRVLVDAPCSSSGIIGMYPDHKWRPASLAKKLSVIQLKLLDTALKLLKKGGIGVYSVCSLNPEEGEFVISEMLQKYDNVELLNPGYGNGAYNVGIPELRLCRRTFPHTNGTDGFFYCKFSKK
ncbi:MAG: RsmB/NOP family class I SAM-dependent RNA methyltransferase [Candidatus Hodarchaeales archaeon]|jgi:16S rRNA (cytosine967-C5)-methyltransferase